MITPPSPSTISPPIPTPEERRRAAEFHERALALAASGRPDEARPLFLHCCQLDPANAIYRGALRRERQRGRSRRSPWRWSWKSFQLRLALGAATRQADHRRVLDLGEQIVARHPDDAATLKALAESAEAWGLRDAAVGYWEEAIPLLKDPSVGRAALARLYERMGDFVSARSHELQAEAEPDAPARACDPRSPAPSSGVGEQKSSTARSLAGASGSESSGSAASGSATDRFQSLRAHPPSEAAPYLELSRSCRTAGDHPLARSVLELGLAATGHAFVLQAEYLDLELDPYRANYELALKRLKERPGDEDLVQTSHQWRREIVRREIERFRLLSERYPGVSAYRDELNAWLTAAGLPPPPVS